MLTKKQSLILSFIKKTLQQDGYIPSIREIGKHVGSSSPATIWEHINNLIQKGFLNKDGKDISVTEYSGSQSFKFQASSFKTQGALDLPLLGSIIAGSPIESWEQKGETLSVPPSLVKDPNSYVLQVRGDSMIEDGILEGDYVIVERNFYPKNGDVVVALLDNAYATLKKFFKEPNRIRLQPANSSMEPIYAKDVAIQGIVRAIIRKFA